MSGEVTANPWKGKNRFMVYVPPQALPDGTKTTGERKVVTAYSKTEALAWGRERRTQIIEEHRAMQRGDLQAKKSKVVTFTKFALGEWVPHLRLLIIQGKRKESSIDAIESALKIHILPFIGSLTLDQVTNGKVELLITKWCTGGYAMPSGRIVNKTKSAKTLNNRKTIVNSCLNYAVSLAKREKRPDLVDVMPCSIDVGHVECDESEHYDAATYERLLEGALSCDLRSYVALLLGGDAGLRRNEILSVKIEDVNFKTGEIMVKRNVFWRRAKHGREMIEGMPKGKKAKPVGATARLLAAIRRLVAGRTTGRVILTAEGEQATPKHLKIWMQKSERAAGLPVTGRMHVLRHSHLTHLAEAGASLLEIASQARHADLRITQRYLHAGQGAARSAVQRLETARLATGVQRSPENDGTTVFPVVP